MGNYNPHAPYILGEEWVPIRQANYPPDDHVTERGYTFRIGHDTAIVSGAYYVEKPPPGSVELAAELIAIYPAGLEDLTGPIKTVIIPVSAVALTGTGAFNATVAALQNPSDSDNVGFQNGSARLGISFDVTNYSQQLFGKRILDLKFLYSMTGVYSPPEFFELSIERAIAPSVDTVDYLAAMESTTTETFPKISEFSFSDINPFWESGVEARRQHRAYPWRYPELSFFAASGGTPATRLIVVIDGLIAGFTNFVQLKYAALQVTYCEETRVRYGGDLLNKLIAPRNSYPTDNGFKYAHLRDINFALGVALPAGEYVVTNTHSSVSRFATQVAGAAHASDSATNIALRQLYELPTLRGVQVNRSLVVDDEFSSVDTDVIPHITLHHAAAIVTGSHAYGLQNDIPVYGAITATQEIEDDPVGSATLFPQVRFYARRFGNTTIPLTLTDVATGLSTVSITVADFDALPEIVDGWREVTLRFATPPSFATAAGDVDWRWTATSELAVNQWQVLGADGPSPTGAQATGPATYYAPQGDTVSLTWQSPAISGTADDPLSDAVLIFSQDPPTVTGFTIETASQEVTGIGFACETPPSCIPSGIGYHHIEWTPQTALPVTGFGYYEIQRSDDVDVDFVTIAKLADTTVGEFDDYEARVGVATTYRIRVVNVLDFVGSWTTSAPTTLAPPGVFGNVGDGNSTLIFTSNEDPTKNLAYVMNWERTVDETFTFPEVDTTQLHRMYGKNFFTAFRPSERGGERFTRSILVQNAAIPLPSLGNFRSLRDMGWADVPYICVRDELGNRWFSTVIVSSGSVRMDRTTYMAQVDIIEVRDTACAVDTTV